MMYVKNNDGSRFVMSVRVNGEFQKELADGSVILPFGTEYSLRFRNKNTRRATVQLFIDGDDLGTWIIPANGSIDIERPAEVNKKFMFVSLDSEDAIDHGKNGSNEDRLKGVVEARFKLEQEVVYNHQPLVKKYCFPPAPATFRGRMPTVDSDGQVYGWTQDLGCMNNMDSVAKSTVNMTGASYKVFGDVPPNTWGEIATNLTINTGQVKDGATVEGSYSSQRFGSAYIETESTYTTLKVVLRGVDHVRLKPIVVKETIEVVEVEDNPKAQLEASKKEAARIKLEIERVNQELANEELLLKLELAKQQLADKALERQNATKLVKST